VPEEPGRPGAAPAALAALWEALLERKVVMIPVAQMMHFWVFS
jgi:hypothetical protein